MAKIAQQFFDNPWMDVPPTKGKYHGAFNYGIPKHHPYILLNYTGTLRDVLTTAHEIGHGIHSMMSAHVGGLQFYPPVTLAETASVFGEMLTFQYLLERETSPLKKKALLASFIEDQINASLRQINFHDFEVKLHQARARGPLTEKDISALWMKAQTDFFGESVVIPHAYASAWVAIPHFMNPFYVYSYAFGQCLVNSLYMRYREDPKDFEAKYIAILKAGNTKPYTALLTPLGMDPQDPLFWNKGLKLIETMIDQLEALDKMHPNAAVSNTAQWKTP